MCESGESPCFAMTHRHTAAHSSAGEATNKAVASDLRLRRPRRPGRPCRGNAAAHGEQQIGLVRAPAIADAEIHRAGGCLEQLLELRLVGAGEDAERLEVVTE